MKENMPNCNSNLRKLLFLFVFLLIISIILSFVIFHIAGNTNNHAAVSNDPEKASDRTSSKYKDGLSSSGQSDLFSLTFTHLNKAATKSITSAINPKRYFSITKITVSSPVYKRIHGKSYPNGCKLPLSDLRYIKIIHIDFGGKVRRGELIVNKKIANDIKQIFYELYKKRYQIRSVNLIDNYWADGQDGNAADIRSVEADNTSAFCYRMIAHRSRLSNHSKGLAIDINPLENPYVINGKVVDHQSSQSYVLNRDKRTHAINKNDLAYVLFKKYGFTWGGSWPTPDYQHFEKR